MIHYTVRTSPLGPITLAATDDGLCGLYFDEHKHFRGAEGWARIDGHAVLREAAQQLDAYFSGRAQTFDLDLDLPGTAFQQTVWRHLRTLPYGCTTTYAAVAQAIGMPSAVRAVGTAIGRNPLCIVLPCHRVLGSSGALTGYAGGLTRKQALLALEQEVSLVREG
ncbi:methylated-DNA-[protein]-cysteine S-methyltransferase [Noviherbaspirillum humi]|uniref:Methylated-DNA--protein-cysteine methyltransferase n=1 Tax=Noviherbaspirillum humi TaxID=1688639 RepID=A0A239C7K5_9BURK|nr:methylated-DNA--[protein]-cysteine S-methyltransferase [Noviherbaspirillum humi]SNS16197.1 methylated-DNA-[protein]-cysteine S-methyltransferase [Noviherbaspirillum humi]